jgi:DNA-directed RNA polymerase subunit RPC12/RpoP
MSLYIKLEDIQAFPIRIDHCDNKNGNIHFILGIESVMEYIDYLPQYELPDAEPIDRPEFAYKDEEEYHIRCPFCKHDWRGTKPFPPFCPNCGKNIINKATAERF